MQLTNLSFLLTDGDTLSWCGVWHLLCVELLHLGKAFVRSSKCLPPLPAPLQQGEHFLLFPSSLPFSESPKFCSQL